MLSHGESAKSGMHIVGADGDWTAATNVASWIAEIEDYPEKPRPHTLFLIDTCHAGDAARLPWLPAAENGTRAWVIAATEPGRLAYNGRFSQAVATILTRIASGAIDLYPGEYVPFGDVVELIRQEVARLGSSHQYVTSTPVDGRPSPRFSSTRASQPTHIWRAQKRTPTPQPCRFLILTWRWTPRISLTVQPVTALEQIWTLAASPAEGPNLPRCPHGSMVTCPGRCG